MNPSLEETITFDFITSSPTTGAVADADSTPTFEVFEDATDTALTLTGSTIAKRTSKTGNYRARFAIAASDGFEAGKSYNVVASATVGGVAGKAVIGRFQARTRDVDDTATQTSVDDLPTNAELATSQAAADDATLAAIAALNNLSAGQVRTELATELGRIDVATSTRMATYTQPTGFLAATFPSDPADQSLIIAATDALTTLIDALPTNAELATALGTADDAVLAQVALVKAKTDLIPASPAAVGSAMTLATNAITTASITDGAYTDAKFTLPTEATGTPSTLLQLIMWIAGMLGWRKVEKDSNTGEVTQFMANGSTVKTVSTYTSAVGVDTLNKAG